MDNINGNMYQKNTSKAFQIESTNDLIKIGLLLLLGFFAVVLRERINIPLKIPGHHGFEFMLLFMAGKTLSRQRYAMSISSIGASVSAFLPLFHFGNAFMPFTFLLPGIIGDLIINRTGKSNYFYAAIAGGLAYSSIPLSRQVIMMTTGIPFPSLFSGLLYPFALHFIFGALGALAGVGIFGRFAK
jgi:hypothetical protein